MSFDIDQKKHQELAQKEVARRREALLSDAPEDELNERRGAIGKVVRISDTSILDDLLSLGFTPGNVGVLPIVPLIAVAWADGDVSKREAKRILDLAEQRGVKADSEAYKMLDELLGKEPSSNYLHGCIFVLRRVYDSLPGNAAKKAKENMLKFSHVIAEASGGIMGLFGNKICDEEQQLIEQIADWLGVNDSEQASTMHRLVATLEDESSEDSEAAEAEDSAAEEKKEPAPES